MSPLLAFSFFLKNGIKIDATFLFPPVCIPMNYFEEAKLFNNLWPVKKVKDPKPNKYANVENIFRCNQKHMKRPKIPKSPRWNPGAYMEQGKFDRLTPSLIHKIKRSKSGTKHKAENVLDTNEDGLFFFFSK